MNVFDRDVGAMVETVRGTIRQIARQYGRGIARDRMEDLCAAGTVGAVIAAQRYDPARGASYNTYARWWVAAYVLEEAIRFWGMGRCPGRSSVTTRVFFRYAKVRREIEASGLDPTSEEIAKRLGVPVSSLEAMVTSQGGDEGVADEMDDQSASMLDTLCDHAEVEEVRSAVDSLGNEKEKYVITQRYYAGRSLRDVAVDLDMSFEGVRQVEKRALRKIKRRVDGKHRS